MTDHLIRASDVAGLSTGYASGRRRYRVLRIHEGDRLYQEGDIREGAEHELKHLVPHVLEPIEEKAESAQLNKAEVAAPANKAATGRKAKSRADEAEGDDE